MDMLARLKKLNDPIKFAMIGAGSVGKGLLYQSTVTPGIQCIAVADRNIAKAIAAAESLHLPHRTVQTSGQLHDAINEGVLAICQDGNLVSRCESADVVIDASSAIVEAAGFAVGAIETGKDLIMMNAEADLIF
ncbi:MAG: homoserine dehydrogenase, partial [Solirubrobacterales bacterium]